MGKTNELSELKIAYDALKSDNNKLTEDLTQIKKAQSGSDSAYQRTAHELELVKKQLTSSSAGLEDQDIIRGRVQNIEKMYDAKVEQLELDYFTKTKCLENGVPYKMIAGFPFKTREEVMSKLEQFTEVIEEVKQADMNDRLLSLTKPKSGQTPTLNEQPEPPEIFSKELESFKKNTPDSF